MRAIFLGTPEFAVAPFIALLESGAEVVAAVTNPDKPFGRKKILTPPPVKKEAQSRGIPVYQYKKIRAEGVEDMKRLKPDIMITCAFGQILSEELLEIPKLGVINVHASLLPKYRGASPVQSAILCGEKETGISIMKTEIGIDTGDVVCSEKLPIGEEETSGELFRRLSVLGAKCLKEALKLIEEGKERPVKQDENFATYTKTFKKEDALIDWNLPAKKVKDAIRAFNPSPVAYTRLFGEPFGIYRARIAEGSGEAGTVLRADKKLVVACGEGAVELLEVQKSGGKVMPAASFLCGNKIAVGERLG